MILTYQAMKVKMQHHNSHASRPTYDYVPIFKNGKVDPVWGSTQPKIRVTSIKALNKSCLKLNFVQSKKARKITIFENCTLLFSKGGNLLSPAYSPELSSCDLKFLIAWRKIWQVNGTTQIRKFRMWCSSGQNVLGRKLGKTGSKN